MLHLGALAFASPWMLLGLVLLPAIWWLLRISPPSPKRVRFPAIRLLLSLSHEEETPAHTPLWLLILRTVLAALIILALADPLWNPAPSVKGSGPLLIVADNGWTSATHWADRTNAIGTLIAAARRDNRPVLVVGTAPTATAPELNFESADDAAARVRALQPLPIAPDRMALLARLQAANIIPGKGAQTVWLSDGFDHGNAKDFSAGLSKLAGSGALEVIEPTNDKLALALLPPATEGDAFTATVMRAASASARTGSVHALRADGGILGEASFTLAPGEETAQARFDLPLELRNRVTRLDIAGEISAGATTLIDERWRRRTVGLVSGSSSEEAQPLLSDLYYLQRAISPYAQIRKSTREFNGESEIADLLGKPLSVLVLADVGNFSDSDRQLVSKWLNAGGVLVRFAGPKLAGQNATFSDDELMPVPLRSGGRALGGALSWTNPQHLAPFDAAGPFSGLQIPGDVTVSRQVLAEPTLELASHTWARLQDGTPLVTAATRGKGLVVFFHVTANSEWSNLPLSGLFVDMLRRVIALSQGVSTAENGAAETTLSPVRSLDGFGRLGTPPATATPISAVQFDATPVGPRHPPGLYGSADGPRAFNLIRAGETLHPLGALTGVTARHPFFESAETRLRPWTLALALVFILADGIAALYVTGLFDSNPIRNGRRTTLPVLTIIAFGALAFAHPAPLQAQSPDAFAMKAATETHLAYVITGDAATDEVSQAGLAGLSEILRTRTSFEAAEPMGVDITRDELAFFPLLYWPMSPAQQTLSSETLARINTYMKNGGVILFDTRDQDRALSGVTGTGTEILRRLMGRLDLPAIEPVPSNHVLTKSFYLLHDFPGRWAGGQVWVEARSANGDAQKARSNDDVSAIVVGSNNYAAAWARDARGRPLYPCEPGGEMQRELSERFGVNLVMYALTGNYKADQVHVPALLERLGQ